MGRKAYYKRGPERDAFITYVGETQYLYNGHGLHDLQIETLGVFGEKVMGRVRFAQFGIPEGEIVEMVGYALVHEDVKRYATD